MIVCQSAGQDVIEVQVQSAVDSAEVVLVQNMSGNQPVCKTKHRRKSSNLMKGKFICSSRKVISLHSSWAYSTQFVSGRKAPRAVATARGRSIHHPNPGSMVACPPMMKKSHGKLVSRVLIYILRAESLSRAADGAVFWHYVVRRLRQKFQIFT